MNWKWLNLLFLLLFLLFKQAESQSIIKTLPGHSGTLPFKLETGYIGVGENDEVQLFYYFIESERNPEEDPLVLWLSGGPGCSGFSTLVYEIGPLAFDLSGFDGSLPSFLINQYSWTKLASIIFVDSPAPTGFSYVNSSQGYSSSDTKSTKENYTFLQKWLLNHPKFIKNRLYIAGDSYGGKIVPMVSVEIVRGNEAGLQPRMSLQGYFIGNAVTYKHDDYNSQIPYAHRMALISDKHFEVAKKSCDGEYVNPDPNNLPCLYALRKIEECVNNIYRGHILEPNCKNKAPCEGGFGWQRTFLDNYDSLDHLVLPIETDGPPCRDQNYATSYVWANDPTVQQALHVRKGTTKKWIRCNFCVPYEEDVESVVQYHKLLGEKGYDALVYSGDHDFGIPYMGTLKWIRDLNLTVDDNWRPWNVNGQIAGYTEKYKKNEFSLTFVTVKGAGHTAPEYMPKECFAMIDRWLSLYPI